jgi:hypothetical protein
MRDSHRKVAGPGRLLRRSLAFACLASLLLGSQSKATASTEIINFSQVSGTNTVVLTNNGAGGNVAGSETISATNVLVTISELNGLTVSPPIQALLSLSASNIGVPATVSGTTVSEEFSGSFSITSVPPAPAFNFLSGTFTDTVSGTVGGTKLELGSTSPPLTLHFTSDVPGMPLSTPNALQFAFTNLIPALTFTGTPGVNASIGQAGPTTMSVSGNASASPSSVIPEPSSFLIAGIGGLGLIGYGLRRRRTLGA